jgi:hypothetical protein
MGDALGSFALPSVASANICTNSGGWWRKGCEHSSSCSAAISEYDLYVVAVPSQVDQNSVASFLRANGAPRNYQRRKPRADGLITAGY